MASQGSPSSRRDGSAPGSPSIKVMLSSQEKKLILAHAAEEQTKNIELYVKERKEQSGPGPLRFDGDFLYEALQQTLSNLMAELNALRLGPDYITLSGLSVKRPNNKTVSPSFAPPSKIVTQVDQALEVTADDHFSLFTQFYCSEPYVPEKTGKLNDFSIQVIPHSQHPDKLIYCLKNCNDSRYMDEFISIKKTATPKSTGYTIDWKGGYKWVFNIGPESIESGDELERTVKAKLDRWKISQVDCVRQLQTSLTHTQIAFDPNSQQHEQLLFHLWNVLFPEEPLSGRVSRQWKKIGFQGTDPSTDFRGMGMLGLEQFVYLAQTRRDWVLSIINSQRNYPFATAAINVSSLLLNFLGIKNFKEACDLPPSDTRWESPLMNFFVYLITKEQHPKTEENTPLTSGSPSPTSLRRADASPKSDRKLSSEPIPTRLFVTATFAVEQFALERETDALVDIALDDHAASATATSTSALPRAPKSFATSSAAETVPMLEEVYCETLALLDHLFVTSNATYLDFPTIFEKTKAYVTELLARRPTSLSQLKSWFKQTILGHTQQPEDSKPSPSFRR